MEDKQVDMALYDLAALLHEARMDECYKNYYPGYRFKFPMDAKSRRDLMHNPHPSVDMALAQAKALIKSGLMKTSTYGEGAENGFRQGFAEGSKGVAERYGSHKTSCGHNTGHDCNCGLSILLEKDSGSKKFSSAWEFMGSRYWTDKP